MSGAHLSPAEIVERGRGIYEQTIRSQVEAAHQGDFLVINVDTGEYEIGRDDVLVSRRAKERFGGALLFTMRVGHDAAYRLGGRFREARSC